MEQYANCIKILKCYTSTCQFKAKRMFYKNECSPNFCSINIGRDFWNFPKSTWVEID